MRIRDIKLLFAYNVWANERILDRASRLSAEQLHASNDLGWGSVFGLLVHILDAEYGWRNYLSERRDLPWLKPGDFADLAAVRARWAEEEAAMAGYLGRLSDDDMVGAVEYESQGEARHYTLWHCLYHMVNHGTQHRSECAALLTGLGHSPGDMDFSVFLFERYGRSDFPRRPEETIAPESIKLLFRYSDWANDRVLERAAQLSPAQLRARNDQVGGSLRDTLVHLMDAEGAWHALLADGVFVDELAPEEFADVDAIRARWTEIRAGLWTYLEGLGVDDLAAVVTYEAEGVLRVRRLWQCLAHLVNHGAQHRSECAALLTAFGQSPGDLDFVIYTRTR